MWSKEEKKNGEGKQGKYLVRRGEEGKCCSIYLHPKYIFMTTEVEIIGQMHWLQKGRLYIPPQICDGCYEKELIGKRGEGR